jgi:hypothetical protein
MERYQIKHPFLLYAGNIRRRRIFRGWWRPSRWCARNWPRIRNTATCA